MSKRTTTCFSGMITLLLLLWYQQARAQQSIKFPDRWTIEILSQEQGLPQHSVEGMAMDEYGFLWLATQGGVVKFDGKKLRTYESINSSTNPGRRIMAMFSNDPTTIYAVDDKSNVYEISKGEVRFHGKYLRSRYGIFVTTTQQIVDAETFAPLKIAHPAFPGVENGGGIPGFRWNKDSVTIIIYDSIFLCSHDRVILKYRVPNLFEAYVAKTGNGFTYLDNIHQTIRLYSIDGSYHETKLPFTTAMPWQIMSNLADDGSSYIYSGCYLFEVQNVNGKPVIKPVLNNFKYEVHPKFIFKKDNNYLVVASVEDGINIYRKSPFHVINPEKYPANTRQSSNFYAQALMPDQKTILTGENKLICKSGLKGTIARLRETHQRTFLTDRQKTYWYSGVDQHKQKLFNGSVPGFATTKYTGHDIEDLKCLYEDKNGNIWTCADHLIGYYTAQDKKFVTVSGTLLDADSSVIVPGYMTEDYKNRLLFGTTSGIYYYDKNEPAKGVHYLALKGINIRFLMVDTTTNDIWACSYGRGLYLIAGNNTLICNFPTDKDGSLLQVHSIIEDAQHRFWLPTNNGLYMTTRENLINYSKSRSSSIFYCQFSTINGLVTNEFNGGCSPAYLKLPDGTVSLPTVKGLVWFQPDSLKMSFPKDSIILIKIVANGKEMQLTSQKTLSLYEPDAKNIIFEVTASDFSTNSLDNIEYLLTSDDEENQWHPVSNQGQFLFTYLKPKNYKLIFRKRIGLGNDDYQYLQVNVEVIPYWFRTIPFYLVVSLAILLVIGLLFRLRISGIKTRNQILEKKITDATRQLTTQNVTLKKSNDVKDKLMSLFNHDISIPVFYIGRSLQRLVTEKSLSEPIRKKIETLATTAADLQILTDDLLVWIQMQHEKEEFDLVWEEVDIAEAFLSKFCMFRSRKAEKHISRVISIPQGLSIMTDRRVFGIIIYNLLANSVKHLNNGTIKVTAEKLAENGLVQIVVTDIAENNTVELKDPIADGGDRPTDLKEEELSRGIGLKLVNDFANQLHLDVTYNFGEGLSQITIMERASEPGETY